MSTKLNNKQNSGKVGSLSDKQLFIFDVNGTLQEPGNDSPMNREFVVSLRKILDAGRRVALLTGSEDARLNKIASSLVRDLEPESRRRLYFLPLTGTVLRKHDEQSKEWKEVYSTAPKIEKDDPIVGIVAEAMDEAFRVTGIQKDPRAMIDVRPTQITFMALGKFRDLREGATEEEKATYAREKAAFEKEKQEWDPQSMPKRNALRQVANPYMHARGFEYEGRGGGATSLDFTLSDKAGSIKHFLVYVAYMSGKPYEELVKASVYVGDELSVEGTPEVDVPRKIPGLDCIEAKYPGDATRKLEDMAIAVSLKEGRR